MAEATNEQMKMAFMDDGMERDPISGNEIPTGSLAEEVRDDVPAMLSEGEYVVPADVLRFYGIKFFEDLRTKAKDGLARMDSMGRIGGEPIEEESAAPTMPTSEDSNVLPFPIEELETEEEEIQMAVGGVINAQEGITVSTVPDELTTGESGFRQIQYWNGQDEGTIFTATFIGDVSISHSPTQLAGYVPYIPEGEEKGEGEDTKPKTPKRKDKDAFYGNAKTQAERDAVDAAHQARLASKSEEGFMTDLQLAGQDITNRLSGNYTDPNRTTREVQGPKGLLEYAKQLKGFGIDDFVTKLPFIGDVTSLALSAQHKEYIEDAKSRLESDAKSLTDEEKTILGQLIAGEEGYTPAKSPILKLNQVVRKKIKDKKEKKKLMQDANDGVGAFRDLSKDKKGTGYKGGRNKGGLMRKKYSTGGVETKKDIVFSDTEQKNKVKDKVTKMADIGQIYDFVVTYGAPAVALGELGLLGYVGKRFFESDEKKMNRYFKDKK